MTRSAEAAINECPEDHGNDEDMVTLACVHYDGFVTSVTQFSYGHPDDQYGVFGPDPPDWETMNDPPDIVSWHGTAEDAVNEMHRRASCLAS